MGRYWVALRGKDGAWSLDTGAVPGGAVIKNPPANAGDTGDAALIPRSGRSPGGRNGKPLQYSCLENPMDRGAWWVIVHRVAHTCTRKTGIQIVNDLIKMLSL